jgi:hypothetical protein
MTVHKCICKLPPPVFTLRENNRGLKVSGFSAKLKELSPCSITQILVNYSHLHLDWFYSKKKRSKWKKQGKLKEKEKGQ